MARKRSNRAERLRLAVQALPSRTRVAMLEGIDRNRIIVGAYTDPASGGICPMLAAHRNGGRTSVASFARAWDAFTGAKRPRRATRREISALRSHLELSLLHDEAGSESVARLARQLRDERQRLACNSQPATLSGGGNARRKGPSDEAGAGNSATDRHRLTDRRATDRNRTAELATRPRWSWLRPTRRYDEFTDLLAAAEEQLAEQRAAELLGDRALQHLR